MPQNNPKQEAEQTKTPNSSLGVGTPIVAWIYEWAVESGVVLSTDQAKLLEFHTTKLLNEQLDRLDKSMPTPEQLVTKYGYHMPEKQYGYKLGLHDIREVIEAERNKLNPSKSTPFNKLKESNND